jgi:hypothetical protein
LSRITYNTGIVSGRNPGQIESGIVLPRRTTQSRAVTIRVVISGGGGS